MSMVIHPVMPLSEPLSMAVLPVIVRQPVSMALELSGAVCVHVYVAVPFVLFLDYTSSNVYMCCLYLS